MSVLAKLKSGINNFKEVAFPGTGHKIRLQLLSEQDTLDSAIATDLLFRSYKVDVEFHNINAFENEKSTQMLFRACRDIETGEPIAADITEFRRLITNEERTALISEYNSLAEECNPDPTMMEADEFDALVESVKKNPRETIGNISSLQTLKRLSLFLAEAPVTSQQDSGPISS